MMAAAVAATTKGWNRDHLEWLLRMVAETELLHDGHMGTIHRPGLGWLVHLTHDALHGFKDHYDEIAPVAYPNDIISMIDRLRMLLPKAGQPLPFDDYVTLVAMFVQVAHTAITQDDNPVLGCRVRMSDQDLTADNQEERHARWQGIIRLYARVAAYELASCALVPWFPATVAAAAVEDVERTAAAAGKTMDLGPLCWHALHIFGVVSVFCLSFGIGYVLCSCAGGVHTCALGHTV